MMNPLPFRPILATFSAFICGVVCACDVGLAGSDSERSYGLNAIPQQADGIDPEEKLGAMLPLNVRFTDSDGREASLREFLPSDRPSLITFNYTNCPGLCMAQLDGLATGINNLESLDLGKDFNLISVNIDPRDKPEDAASKKDKYTGRLAKHHARSGWHFLTGKPADIQSLTKAAGFYYTYDAKADQYNHSAMAIAVSPKGKLTRYLYNLSFEPETLKLSLIEASDGTIGTPFDQFTLWCYHYDPLENRYSADARKLLSFAAGACVLVVLGGVAPFWFARRSAKSLEAYRAAALADPSDVDESGTNQPSKSSTPERSP